MCRVYERACRAALDAGWEFMGHGFVQKPMHKVDDQLSAIADTIAMIRDFTGRAPRGWESPGLTETLDTLDHLAEAGIEYVCNWPFDDLPVEMQTKSGPILSLPYPVEVNDVVMSAVQQQPSDEILRRGRDNFERLYQEGATIPRIMAISIHPYLTGVPHRIKYLEMLLDHVLGAAGCRGDDGRGDPRLVQGGDAHALSCAISRRDRRARPFPVSPASACPTPRPPGIASATAFMMAASAPVVPASPTPFTPSGLVRQKTGCSAALTGGMESARGIA